MSEACGDDHVAGPLAEQTALAVLGWASVFLFFLFRISSTVADLDLFHEMALAREALMAGSVPRADVYAFTPTKYPIVHHEWGAGLLAYVVATSMGGTGIQVLKYTIAAVTLLVAVRMALRLGGERTVVLLMSAVAVVLVDNGYSVIRAHAYSFLCAVLTLWCIERDRAGTGRWMLPYALMFIAWVNLHGGAVIACIILVAYAAELVSQRKPAAHIGICVAVLLALMSINPFGFAIYGYVVSALTLQRALIAEWQPMWSGHVPTGDVYAFAASIIAAVYALAYGPKRSPDGLGIVAATGAMALRSARFLPFYAIAWLVYVPRMLRGTALEAVVAGKSRRTRMAVAAGCVLLGATSAWRVGSISFWRVEVPNAPSDEDQEGLYYPVAAVECLRRNEFHGNLMTPFNHGAYVSWKLYPNVKVSLDSRYEVAYPPTVFEDITDLYSGEAVSVVLERYAPDLLLVPKASRLAGQELAWPKVYEDSSFAIHKRPHSGVKLTGCEYLATSDVFP